MNPMHFIMIGTVAVAITISNGVCDDKTNTNAIFLPLQKFKPNNTTDNDQKQIAIQDAFHEALGADSDEEIYRALYKGDTLADIATKNNKDVPKIIDLQLAQMHAQLDQRLAQGSLSETDYAAQREELREIITNSVYGHI